MTERSKHREEVEVPKRFSDANLETAVAQWDSATGKECQLEGKRGLTKAMQKTNLVSRGMEVSTRRVCELTRWTAPELLPVAMERPSGAMATDQVSPASPSTTPACRAPAASRSHRISCKPKATKTPHALSDHHHYRQRGSGCSFHKPTAFTLYTPLVNHITKECTK